MRNGNELKEENESKYSYHFRTKLNKLAFPRDI